jgi:hypothetical protein
MPPAGFEPTIPVSERPQTQALDRAVTGIGDNLLEQFTFNLITVTLHWLFLPKIFSDYGFLACDTV